MAGMYCMSDLLALVLREGVAEMRLVAEQPPVLLRNGAPATSVDPAPLTNQNILQLLQSIATPQQLAELNKCGDAHFVYVFQDSARFAVAAAMQSEALEVKIRNLTR